MAFLFSIDVFATDETPDPGAGEKVKKTDISGGVVDTDSKKPISNVSVTAVALNKKEKVAFTDVNGNFSFDDLKPGTYKFVFEKTGYKKQAREKTLVRVDEALLLNISLEEHSTFDFMPGPSHFFDN
jgi:hypothetical protein